MTLIDRGDKPRDRCHSADYHTNISTSNAENAIKLSTTPEFVFLTMNAIYSI